MSDSMDNEEFRMENSEEGNARPLPQSALAGKKRRSQLRMENGKLRIDNLVWIKSRAAKGRGDRAGCTSEGGKEGGRYRGREVLFGSQSSETLLPQNEGG